MKEDQATNETSRKQRATDAENHVIHAEHAQFCVKAAADAQKQCRTNCSRRSRGGATVRPSHMANLLSAMQNKAKTIYSLTVATQLENKNTSYANKANSLYTASMKMKKKHTQ